MSKTYKAKWKYCYAYIEFEYGGDEQEIDWHNAQWGERTGIEFSERQNEEVKFE